MADFAQLHPNALSPCLVSLLSVVLDSCQPSSQFCLPLPFVFLAAMAIFPCSLNNRLFLAFMFVKFWRPPILSPMRAKHPEHNFVPNSFLYSLSEQKQLAAICFGRVSEACPPCVRLLSPLFCRFVGFGKAFSPCVHPLFFFPWPRPDEKQG